MNKRDFIDEAYQSANYSKQHGTDLTNKSKNRFILNKSESNICLNCNLVIDKYSGYCKVCGTSNEEINENIESKKLDILGKEEVVIGTMATGILFIIALFINISINIISTKLGDTINTLQIMMIFNLIPLKVYLSTIFGSGIVIAKLGFIMLVLLPFISIAIANKVISKNTNQKPILYKSMGVGIVYALWMVIIGVFASINYNFTNSIQYGITVRYYYNLVNTFFNSCVIGTILTYLICIIYKYKNMSMYEHILYKVIKSIGLSYILILIILTIITISDKSYLSELGLYSYSNKISIVAIMTQLAIYMLAFSNFIPISIGESTLSPFNILSSGLFLETKLVFFSMIAASLLVILIIGYSLKENSKENNIKPVIIFSIVYSLSMGILSILSSIMLGGDISFLGIDSLQSFIKMGFPLIYTLVGSFIYSFVVSLVGYKLN